MHPYQHCRTSCSNSFGILFSIITFVFTLLRTMEAVTVKLPANITIPAIFAFGDSIVDAGNNNMLVSLARSNFLPYGQDFQGGKPTGRFSNGKVPTDLLAEGLGIKKLLPSYLNSNLKTEDLLTGVTFASGASGYDPLTPILGTCYSITDQVNFFKEYIKKITGIVGEERANSIISQSVFLVVFASNDVATTYPATRTLQYDIDSYADFLIPYASALVKDLYALGARRYGVFSLPPIGCIPSQRAVQGGPQRQCAKRGNDASIAFNTRLSAELNSLKTSLPDSLIFYIDIYYPLLNLINNPQKYGFEIVDRGCCGTGTIEASVFCNRYVGACANVSKHIFWDGFHPTEKAYAILADQILESLVDSF